MTRPDLDRVYDAHLRAERAHDALAAAATYAPDGFYHHVPLGFTFRGREAVAGQYAANYAALPDVDFTIEGEVAEGDRLVHWGVMHATVSGSFLGQPATGRRVALPFVARIDFRGAEMLGETLWYDLVTLCDQAGLSIDGVRSVASALRASAAREA